MTPLNRRDFLRSAGGVTFLALITKLTYRANGRDIRLTDVYGTLIPQIVG